MTPRRLVVENLEARLTPASTVFGPYSVRELESAAASGAACWAAVAGPGDGLVTRLDTERLNDLFAAAPPEFSASPALIALPRPDGSFARFRVWEAPMWEAGLAAQLPGVRTFRGQGVDRPTDLLAADFTPAGFRARVIGPAGVWQIDPADGMHISHPTEPVPGHSTDCGCAGCGAATMPVHPTGTLLSAGGGVGGSGSGILTGGNPIESSGSLLRTYRFAVASTGEYTAFSGGAPAALANIVTLVNRINLVLERDFSARLVLIANNQQIVYSSATTDPYTGDNPFALVEENQTNLDAVIGTANYDLGHVVSANASGGGIGYTNAIGAPWRAGGATIAPTWDTPTGFAFESNFIHEIGHQFGGLHTFNGVNGAAAFNRNGTTAVEVGSGSSIMAYPGISGTDDLQPAPDLFFHSITYDQAQDFLATIPNVGVTVPTGNTPPVVFAGLDAAIPALTPFALTAAATDADGDSLTYSWEQRDIGQAQALGSADNGYSPLFRAFAPTTDPTRTFPRLNNLLAGAASVGETLPATDRTMRFRVMVRDNRVGGGGVALDDVTLTVVNTGSAFAVTSPNTAVSWPAGTAQTITWNVAGTSGGAINAPLVNIRLSTDGGLTFPTVLAANTPNDGSEPVVLPLTPTATARIKIEPVGNYFFDISDTNFTITTAPAMRVVATTPSATGYLQDTLDLTFTQPLEPNTLQISDFGMSRGTVTAVSLLDAKTVRLSVDGLASEGDVIVTLPAGAVTDTGGNPNGAFAGRFVVDVATTPFPVALAPLGVAGTLSYTGSAEGRIQALAAAADLDTYTIQLNAGQTLSVSAIPDADLKPRVRLTGPGGVDVTVGATRAGQPAVISAAKIATAGLYSVAVSGQSMTLGAYSLRLDLNAAAEVEPNDTTAHPQPIVASAFDLGGGATRWSFRGRTDSPTQILPAEIEPNDTPATANAAALSFAPYSGNLYQLGFSTGIDFDVFKLGTFQPGDLITQAQYGVGSGRGTQTDPYSFLFRGTDGIYLGYDDNSGPGSDALFYRFNVDEPDVYFGGASGFYFFGDTIQMGYLLENVGAPPLTGSPFVDSEPNQTTATATDVSKAWRPVQFQSVTNATISSATDVDHFSYTFAAGDLVTVLVHATGSLDPAVTLRNSSGLAIAFDPGDGGGLVPEGDAAIYAYRVPAAGRYTVEVKARDGTGGYTLRTLLSTDSPPAVPADFVTIPLVASDIVAVALHRLSPGAIALDIVDSKGVAIVSGQPGPTNMDLRALLTAPASGTYTLRITGDPGVEYAITATANAAFDSEPNDSFATAQPFTAGRALGAVSATDADWFQVAASAGQLIAIATATPGAGSGQFGNALDPFVELYSPANALIAADDNSGGGKNASITVVASVSGLYRVRISGAGGTAGEYILTAPPELPPVVSAVQINGGQAQRSRVTSLAVTFNEPVTIAPGAFSLVRQSDNAVVQLAAVQTGNTVSFTFAGGPVFNGSLADGRYTLSINAAGVIDETGLALDGNGDGVPGDNFVLAGNPTNTLFRLYGDIDGNGVVAASDFLAFRIAFLSNNPVFDFDGDSVVGASDFLALRLRFLKPI